MFTLAPHPARKTKSIYVYTTPQIASGCEPMLPGGQIITTPPQQELHEGQSRALEGQRKIQNQKLNSPC